MYLHQGMSHILEDAGYEIVHFEELKETIERQSSGDLLSCGPACRPCGGQGAAGVLTELALWTICVTSVSSLGLGELNNEGEYEQRLRMGVTTKLYEAKWGQRGVPGTGRR